MRYRESIIFLNPRLFRGKKPIEEKEVRNAGLCENCGLVVPKVYAVHEMELCRTCRDYFRLALSGKYGYPLPHI